MDTPRKDPLLLSAKVLTIFVRVMLVIGMVFLGIGMAVMAIGAAGWLPDNVTSEIPLSMSGAPLWAAVLALFAAVVTLGLAFDFVARLARIIDTVSAGDPFSLANAARLFRMAWLALGVQLASSAAALLGEFAEQHIEDGHFEFESYFSLNGIALALILFILARVFRKGAEMRDELEGTV